jgi:hypothetical protein
VEALHLPVGARLVGLGGEALDAAISEQLPQRSVVHVGECLSVISRLVLIPRPSNQVGARPPQAVTVAAFSSGKSSLWAARVIVDERTSWLQRVPAKLFQRCVAGARQALECPSARALDRLELPEATSERIAAALSMSSPRINP